ncbi:AraC family transcriptional regulator [Synechococcus sp. BDU 130192]|uniref:AraC family transcriptional regulator n=1 Tax=Synechococcus sp. BDU 130192 TaxID=2042059 RepID=UPI000C0724D7|nr:AraC family transcriptional regulator [Synechococcus sp. BDU 130192]
MTIILTTTEYEQLWETSFAQGKIQFTENDWSYAMTWQHPFGEKKFQSWQLRSGLTLDIGENKSDCDWGLAIEHPDSYPLTLAFQLAGKTRVLTQRIKKDHYYEVAGKSYLFAVAGSDEVEEKLAGEKLLSVRIRIQPDFFRTLCSHQPEEFPQKIRSFIEKQNQAVFHHCMGNLTPGIQLNLKQILNCPYQGVMKQIFLESKALELITLQFNQLNVLETGRKRTIHLRPPEIEAIHHAKDILISHLDNPPSLLDLARQVGLGERKLKQGFRTCFGKTTFQYLHSYRMDRARELLAEGRMSVAEVASLVGYSHLSHFAAAFKRKFGMNPSIYARSRS